MVMSFQTKAALALFLPLVLCADNVQDNLNKWVQTPGLLYACAGDDVTFNWEYVVPDTSIPIRFYLFEGSTMFSVYDNGRVIYYHDYQGRVDFILEGSNASMILKNVSASDSGLYRLHLSGTTLKSEARLTVLSGDDLKPDLLMVDGSKYNISSVTSSIPTLGSNVINITVLGPACSTCDELRPNIFIVFNDTGDSQQCLASEKCTLVANLEDVNRYTSLMVRVDYGTCHFTQNLTPKFDSTQDRPDDVHVQKKEWVKTPGSLYACVGDDVTFYWEYLAPENSIPIRFYLFEGSTMFSVYDNGRVIYYHDYQGRVDFILEGSNGSMILKNVSASDSGLYRLHLSGTTLKSEARLTVLSENDPTPILLLVNGSEYNITNVTSPIPSGDSDIINITVLVPACSACDRLRPNIFMILNDISESKQCAASEKCTIVANLEDANQHTSLMVRVDYGTCLFSWNWTLHAVGNTQAVLDTQSPMADDSLPYIIVGCLGVAVMITFITVITLYCTTKRKIKKKKTPQTPNENDETETLDPENLETKRRASQENDSLINESHVPDQSVEVVINEENSQEVSTPLLAPGTPQENRQTFSKSTTCEEVCPSNDHVEMKNMTELATDVLETELAGEDRVEDTQV